MRKEVFAMYRLASLRLLLPALALGLLLTACGGGSSAQQPYDPAAVSQALLDSDAFSEPLDEMDADIACGALYRIDAQSVTGCAVYTSLTAGAEELAVLTLSDEEAAKTALSALEQRVADQKEALRSYQPEEVAKLDQAIVKQQGNSVLLVVAADQKAAQAVLDTLN